MDYSSVWAIWSVAITGPCVISWLAGDIAGASRTRQLYEEKALSAGADRADQRAHQASVVEEWRVPGAVHPLAEAVERAAPEAFCPPSFTEEAARAECRRLERASLAAPSRSIVGDWVPVTGAREPMPDPLFRQSVRPVGDQRSPNDYGNARAQYDRVQIIDEREVLATRPS